MCRCDSGYESVGLGCVPSDCSLTECSGHGACVAEGAKRGVSVTMVMWRWDWNVGLKHARVNWHEVAAYANALSGLEGLGECYSCTGTAPTDIDCAPSGSYASPYDCPGYRLPTEAEWEYAARGGDPRATYAGELTGTDCSDTTVDPIAWVCGNASSTTHPVGTKTANAYGLYDMPGNVREWCHDWYAAYPGGAETDPAGPPSGSQRCVRGSAWYYYARDARAAYRGRALPDLRNGGLGGRILRASP
jgi:formylglycine-generating enzyme required for sulfatase activity